MATQSGRREYLSLAVIATVLVCAVWLARSHAESLKEFIDHHAIAGGVVYIVLNILDAVIAPGATLRLIPVAAHVWGRIAAALMTTVGWTAGSLIAFYIARRWGSPLVKKLTSMEYTTSRVGPLENVSASAIIIVGLEARPGSRGQSATAVRH
jgi:uncharacterized membrane protein YdjX (TVP38/TMEM64 family)